MKQPNVDKMLAEIDTGQFLEWAAFYKVREAVRKKEEKPKDEKKTFFLGIMQAVQGYQARHEREKKRKSPGEPGRE